MTIQEAISKRIIQLCQTRGITPNKLGTLSKIDPSTITSIFYGKSKNPSALTITKICAGLDISIKQFFDDKLFELDKLDF